MDSLPLTRGDKISDKETGYTYVCVGALTQKAYVHAV